MQPARKKSLLNPLVSHKNLVQGILNQLLLENPKKNAAWYLRRTQEAYQALHPGRLYPLGDLNKILDDIVKLAIVGVEGMRLHRLAEEESAKSVAEIRRMMEEEKISKVAADNRRASEFRELFERYYAETSYIIGAFFVPTEEKREAVTVAVRTFQNFTVEERSCTECTDLAQRAFSFINKCCELFPHSDFAIERRGQTHFTNATIVIQTTSTDEPDMERVVRFGGHTGSAKMKHKGKAVAGEKLGAYKSMKKIASTIGENFQWLSLAAEEYSDRPRVARNAVLDPSRPLLHSSTASPEDIAAKAKEIADITDILCERVAEFVKPKP